jgi:hypothetical protein
MHLRQSILKTLRILLVLTGLHLTLRAADQPQPQIHFNRDIRPILSDHCFHCHGPDAEKRKAHLRLDTESGAKSPIEGRYPIHPKHPNKGTILERIISTDPDDQMPPPSSGRHLSPQQIHLLKAWIAQGAPWQPHWSFTPPSKPLPPSSANTPWSRNPIDQFILHQMNHAGLHPAPPAPPEKLLRRLHLDLTGLPPSPDTAAAFLADPSEEAYSQLVDKLLASPHFGEHLATRWLNAARYADTNGYQSDGERSMWRWRDWVIQQFNQNAPFDRMTIEQIAGDLLPNPSPQQRIATGFNRNHRGNAEGGIVPEEYAAEYVADRVETTATVWLGLTLNCARCHDHKYDPISQRDFYSLFAFFNNVPEHGRALKIGNSPPLIPAPTPEQQTAATELQSQIDHLQTQLRNLEPSLNRSQSIWESQPDRLPQHWIPSLPTSFRADLPHQITNANTRTVGHLSPTTIQHSEATHFDGDAFLEIPNTADFDFLDAFAFSARIHPKKLNGTILSKTTESQDTDPSSSQNEGYTVQLENGRLLVTFTKRWLDDALRVRTQATIPQDQWTHIAVSYDGSRLANGVRIHFNGEPQPTEILLDALNQTFKNANPLRIGTGGSPATRFHGAIRDFAVHPESLSDQQALILACADAPKTIAAIPPSLRSPTQLAALHACFLQTAANPEIRESFLKLDTLQRELRELTRAFPTVMVMEEMTPPRTTHVLLRGEYNQLGPTVQPAVPAFLPQLPNRGRATRLDLAKWIVSDNNPLTKRVIVNQLWQMIFGTGLVRTPEDFGAQGTPPSHPELLDWLASHFGETGWNIRSLLRSIVTSATYRQSQSTKPESISKDPDNILLARAPRFRLPAETLRDQALAASGLLVPKIGGPSVKPYQPDGLWQELGGNAYVQDHGESLWRRSLYTFWKRTSNPPLLSAFDASGRETCSVRYTRTNTPLQALATMNETAFVEAARRLAERAFVEKPESIDATLKRLFQLVLIRDPAPSELAILRENHQSQIAHFKRHPDSATKMLGVGEAPRSTALPPPELAALAAVANLVLNLDETLTRP